MENSANECKKQKINPSENPEHGSIQQNSLRNIQPTLSDNARKILHSAKKCKKKLSKINCES